MNTFLLPFRQGGLSVEAIGSLSPRARNFLTELREIDWLETCESGVRRNWQRQQIGKLLRHAASRSPFWRERIASARDITGLPPQTRADVRMQVQEGSLLRASDGMRVYKGRSSGSSGSPVEFFQSERNSSYGIVRTTLQMLRAHVPLQLNIVDFRNVPEKLSSGFRIEARDPSAFALSDVMETGTQRHVKFNWQFDEDKLISALMAQPCEVITGPPRLGRLISRLVGSSDPRLSKLGIRYYMPRGDHVEPDLRTALAGLGIVTLNNYSSTEVGPIGDECSRQPACYHVATSNVVLELGAAEQDGLRPLLITHLHSYATPFIRYDIGDAGDLAESCPHCGHKGPTITRLHGRRAGLVRLANGTARPFDITFKFLRELVGELRDFRITQESLTRFSVEIDAGRVLTDLEKQRIASTLRSIMADAEYEIISGTIDWGKSSKRHTFRSRI